MIRFGALPFEELGFLGVPSRSRLYNLQPIAIGTSHIESLTSYIARLATVHCVDTRTFVSQEILPLLGKDYLLNRACKRSQGFWLNNTRMLNGTQSWAKGWVLALENLTTIKTLNYLTMLTWSNVIAFRGLLRSVKAWCPNCYTEWQEANKPLYEPLLWHLHCVTTCPQHRCYLCDKCPCQGCKKEQPILSPRAKIGFCTSCGHWLGSPQNGDIAPSKTNSEWEIWIAEAVGELLAEAPKLLESPIQETICQILSLCIGQAGGASALAQEITLSRDTIQAIRKGQQTPQLLSLLYLSYYIGVKPYSLLSRKIEAKDIKRVLNPFTTPLKRARPKPPDLPKLREALAKALTEEPAPSMKTVAKRLSYDQTFLSKHLPDLTKEISTRFINYQKRRALERQ